ncbi:putative E3 ubiquitin-protein ligase LIN-1 isoform X2 [Cajanus cajan]|uniref:putative E3 ubiquitin-protein ligase LIN-1 isoform X2 n=1 Tax=Cajanus cajan TaxID=3821 RepID=UPI0010FB33D4|nr:putative E3 ubiquitin-protein ligase LIN-1 isoform X2 [Cajanus cajan]
MASTLEELLEEEGFKESRRMTKSRSSFHHGASSEPLYSVEGRFSVSSERIRTHRTSSGASRYQITSGQIKVDSLTAKNGRSRDNVFLRDKMDERLKNEIEKNSSTDTDSAGKGVDTNSPEYMPRYEIPEVIEQESSRVKDTYSKEVSAKRGKETNFNELVEEPVKDAKVHSRSSSMHMLRHSSETRKNIKPQKDSYSTSKSKSFDYSSRNKNSNHAMQEASTLALDEAAIKAVVSILNGYIKRFPKDEDFRSSLRHKCFSSFNFIELEEENNSETKVIRSLEQAIEAIEETAEEPISTTYLKRTTMQLSIITGLSLNDLKYECTCGIPNYKLSACAHLYLSVVYMMQKKNKVSAKHLLQVFCDSPSQARTILLPELWEHLFSPQFSHLKAWYKKEAEVLVDAPSKTRKLKFLQKVYNEHLDSGTRIFAVYYKDWLTEGVESPHIPSISIPSVSVTGSQEGSSLGHSFESTNSVDSFSPQPMVSKKLYDSMFGSSSKPRVYQVKDIKDDDNLEKCVHGSYGSTIVKQTLTYESETVKFTDQDIEDFVEGVAIDTIKPKGTSMTLEESQKRNLSDDTNNSFSMQTKLSSHVIDDFSHEKSNDLALKKPNKTSSALVGSYFPSIPQEFICPLTGNIFEEPVTLETGQTFEREAIKAWFEKGNRTCPVTGNTLECVVMPFTNLILKRLIDNWKSERFDYLLDLASQTIENSEEFKLNKKDEAAVFVLVSLLSSLKEEEKSTYAKHLISLGVLPFLFRRFEKGNVQEKSHVVSLLLNCIQVDPGCIYMIARSVNRKCLLELLHSKEDTPTTNAIRFLTGLLSMKRRKDFTSFISRLAGEKVFNIMHILLMYLKNSSFEKPLIAVLLLHFDLLIEPQKFSIYREVAVNGIAEALDASLNDDKSREKCCRALLILCGHFSSTGKIPTKTSILKQAGYNNDSLEGKPLGHEEEGKQSDATISWEDEDEEKRGEELLKNLLKSLIGDGESPFLKSIYRCLDCKHLELVRTCLITVTWLSSSLSTLFGSGLHLPAFLSIISQLKGILENGELELKTLASLSLLNFSKISECRTLLKTMADDIAPLLHGLVEVTWTAKQLHAIVSRENL